MHIPNDLIKFQRHWNFLRIVYKRQHFRDFLLIYLHCRFTNIENIEELKILRLRYFSTKALDGQFFIYFNNCNFFS